MDVLGVMASYVIACTLGSIIGGLIALLIAKRMIQSDRKITLDVCFLQLELKSLDELDDLVKSVLDTLRMQDRVLDKQVEDPRDLLAFVHKLEKLQTNDQFKMILKMLEEHSKVSYPNGDLAGYIAKFQQGQIDVKNKYLYDGEATTQEARELKEQLQATYTHLLDALPKVRESIALRRSDIRFIYGW